jgi:hypothetical protein
MSTPDSLFPAVLTLVVKSPGRSSTVLFNLAEEPPEDGTWVTVASVEHPPAVVHAEEGKAHALRLRFESAPDAGPTPISAYFRRRPEEPPPS